MIDEMMPYPRRYPRVANGDPIDSSTWETTILCATSGYIRYVDTERLLAAGEVAPREGPSLKARGPVRS